MRKIDVIIKRPGEKPYRTSISDSLENLQRTVEGYIQAVPLAEDLAIICNEEGRLIGMPHNCSVCGVDFVGPIIFVGVDGEEFTDIPQPYSWFKRCFPGLWEA